MGILEDDDLMWGWGRDKQKHALSGDPNTWAIASLSWAVVSSAAFN